MQTLIQSYQNQFIVSLTNNVNNPVTGLIFSNVSCYYKKANSATFTTKSLNSSNFVALGGGYYQVLFTSGECDTLGSFVVVVNGASVSQFVGYANIVAGASSSIVKNNNTCNVFGYVNDLQNNPIANTVVNFKLLELPSINLNSGVINTVFSVKTDVNGFFTIELQRLLKLDIIIQSIGYRTTYTVPNKPSSNLLGGL